MAKSDSSSSFTQQASSHLSDIESPGLEHSDNDTSRLLQQRLELVEDLWKTVLKSECPPEQTARLLRLKQLSDPISGGVDTRITTSDAIVLLIREMDLAEAISAARAFSLYLSVVFGLYFGIMQ